MISKIKFSFCVFCFAYILLQAAGRCSSASMGLPIFSVNNARRRAQSVSSTVTSLRHLLTWWGDSRVIRRAMRGMSHDERCFVSSWAISPVVWKLSSRFDNVCLMLWQPANVLTPKMSFKWRHSSRVMAAVHTHGQTKTGRYVVSWLEQVSLLKS